MGGRGACDSGRTSLLFFLGTLSFEGMMIRVVSFLLFKFLIWHLGPSSGYFVSAAHNWDWFKINNHVHCGYDMHVGDFVMFVFDLSITCVVGWTVLWGLIVTLLEVTFISFFSFMVAFAFYFVPSILCLEGSQVLLEPNRTGIQLFVQFQFCSEPHVCY